MPHFKVATRRKALATPTGTVAADRRTAGKTSHGARGSATAIAVYKFFREGRESKKTVQLVDRASKEITAVELV